MNYNEKAEEIFNSLTKRKKFADKMPSNISQGESGVLLYLLNNDSVSQSELSEKLNITMPRVAAIIKTLQDKMLVIKKTDLNDKRKTIITITEKGKKDILQKRKRAIIFIESIIKELTDEEIMQYISINKKIEEISNNLKNNTVSNMVSMT